MCRNHHIRFYFIDQSRSFLGIHCKFAPDWDQRDITPYLLQFFDRICVSGDVINRSIHFQQISQPAITLWVKGFQLVIGRLCCDDETCGLHAFPGRRKMHLSLPGKFAQLLCHARRGRQFRVLIADFENGLRIKMIVMRMCNAYQICVVRFRADLKRVKIDHLGSLDPDAALCVDLNMIVTHTCFPLLITSLKYFS